tara:strand:- start:980 stop:1153 length:174 start_codon:yes stop_codon:yes gene_type:complete
MPTTARYVDEGYWVDGYVTIPESPIRNRKITITYEDTNTQEVDVTLVETVSIIKVDI